jgi:serine/threonine protein kinase
MAPEQARGVIVDKRADIWAFGVVLYEMLTGKQPFVGATVSDTLAAVLRAEPKWDAIPFGIRRLVQRCLDKDPKRRLQAIGDARLEIEDFLAAPEAPAPTARRTVLPWVVSTTLLVALAVLMLVHLRERPTESPVVRYSISAPEKAGFIHLVPSPDGRQIAFTGGKLFVRRLDSLTSQPLTGTDSALLPFWSPDSRFVGYFADGKLKRIDLGAPSHLTRRKTYPRSGRRMARASSSPPAGRALSTCIRKTPMAGAKKNRY